MQLTEITTQKNVKMAHPVGFEPTGTGRFLNKINNQKSFRMRPERVDSEREKELSNFSRKVKEGK